MDTPETLGGVPAVDRNESVSPSPTPRNPETVSIEIDDSRAAGAYANFCRLSGTPEELLIEFGVNPQPMGVPTQPIVLHQRVVTNWYTAKRLLAVLQQSVARHEAAFGTLETDVQKRVRRT